TPASTVVDLPMKPRKAAITFIFITVMLDMLALGLIAPVLPKLIELSRRQPDQCSNVAWHFRHCFRPDAVFLFTGPGCVVRPVRTTTGNLVVEPRAWLGLYCDGAFADDRLALSWPHHFRHYRLEYS